MTVSADVVVIGAGVVGAAVARELARYELDVMLIEAGPDVGAGTSKANTAIWHTGFDATPGSLESRLLRRSYPLMQRFVDEVGVPAERTGAILVAWDDEQLASFPTIVEKAARNGVTDLVRLMPDELRTREPHLGAGALGGLLIPGEWIICPYTPPLAFATEAVRNGVVLRTNAEVTAARRSGQRTTLRCGDRDVSASWVVNCAGLGSDAIDALFGHARFTVKPRRGELIVFDKMARELVRHVLLPVPTKTTKGVLVSPTVFGNVLLGPTAEELDDKRNTSTSAAGIESLLEKGRRIMPELLDEEITATYAGLRAATGDSDYQLHLDASQRYVCVGGIRSTGLSASLGIAEYVVELMREAGLRLVPKAQFTRVRMPPIGQAQVRPHEDARAIAANSDYGRIVCHCEAVTRGEIEDALHAAIPAPNLDGLRRRTRCLQGRCQGFYCLASVASLLARARGVSVDDVLGGPRSR